MSLRVLVVQADTAHAQPLVRFFRDRGDDVWEAWDLGQADLLFSQVKPDLLVFDLHFQGDAWLRFLRKQQHRTPNLKIILTSRTPDVQREIQAQALGIKVFLRQPYRPRWVQAALDKLETETPVKAEAPKVRFPVRFKITLPYMVLALALAMAAALVASQVVFQTVQDRFYNQLVATAKQSSDWMVREESRLLEDLRLIANTQGVADAVQAGDAEALRQIILPLALNDGDEAIEVLDGQGTSVLSLRKLPNAADYEVSRGETYFQQVDFVQAAMQGKIDEQGDKYAGAVRAPWGNYFYIAGPIFNTENRQIGTLLVGGELSSLVRRMSQATVSLATIYGMDGEQLASALYPSDETSFPLAGVQVMSVLGGQDQGSQTRNINVNGLEYTELLGPWEVRSGADLGVIGVSLGQVFLMSTSQAVRLQILLLVGGGLLLVVLVGVFLADRITGPITRLVRASSEVARGNLNIKVESQGNDEVAVLAHSFNYMVAGLQEGSIYRDLLGRTVSPEVREQLRQTFKSGGIKLEGQQAISTVLMTDVRSFTSLSEQTDPATVFHWLNEYFERIVPLVVKAGGVVNKFDGDAMLAFFGILPSMLEPQQSALIACQTALQILNAINELNDARVGRGDPPLVTGIGINTGEVMAGGLGTRDRLHYTIIGDTVNTTQRLEGLTRQAFKESGVLVSHATYESLGDAQSNFYFEPLGLRSVKGKAERIMVYRLLPARLTPRVDVML